ncbi:hypothetical protein PF005_g18423 [Phytophthora fragariae]|uniref:Uncharacterized protein n=1 Tax=Phytophthora fragariae TaxID=53985 RepID=A0A6A3WXN6_9STRA|nr:hypothetical protein PF003_g9128 [Phytophthora fragariae]KAE9192532.1 hypothetical protein PF005_g18423 [Phytophthora fragariae]KAE9206733.1 hypothetical protein PF004_g17215 [Phytophthora fragariae]KAE9330026.1 hypothetical protein PF008_g15810 [Phytophthora fragariae]
MMTLVVAQELVPLQDPSEGSLANYGFWIRASLLTAVIAHTAAVQFHYLVDRVKISQTQCVAIACCVGSTFPVLMMHIAAMIVFPIPFIPILTFPVFYVLLIISFRVVAGKGFFRDAAADMDQTIRFVKYISCQVLLIIVYPAYQALFSVAVATNHELVVMLMLPIIKSLIKYLLLRMTTHMEDLTPESVIFTVDFFNALYLATSMQRATSTTTIVTFVALDMFHLVFGLYGHFRRTSSIQGRLREVVGGCDQGNLLTAIALLCRKPDIFARQVRSGIQLHSSLSYRLPDGTQQLLNVLGEIKSSRSCRHRSHSIHPSTPQFFIVVPHSFVQTHGLARVHPVVPTKADESAFILQETLETMFTSECHVLTEYLESIIPVLYGCFVLMIVRLPNAKYHLDLEGITRENATTTVHSVFVLAALELLSFIVLAVVMQRNCG